jgi:hypothetical protein
VSSPRYICYCLTVTILFLWGALSDERTGLSFIYAAGPCQRSLSRVRVRLDSRPYFTVSDMRLPFSSPTTTRRVTVEVFDPIFSPSYSLSLYSLGSDPLENMYHVSECVFMGPLPSTVHGAGHIEISFHPFRVLYALRSNGCLYIVESVASGIILPNRCLAISYTSHHITV